MCAAAQMASAEPSMIRGSMHHCTRWGTTIQTLYKDQKDEALHERAIEKLALTLNRPIAPVKIVYENEYARLKSNSKVTKFLGVFASRRARDSLLKATA
jgi:hypothetical protein